MTFRWFANSTFLALVLVVQHPSSGSAGDRSPTGLLREASTYAARMEDAGGGKHLALQSILYNQRKAGDETGAMMTAELESIPGNRDNAWAIVVETQASKGDITGAKESLARISEKIARANALASIAVAYAANGDVSQALNIAGQIPDNYYAHGDAFFRIAAIQAKAGDVPGALHAVKDKWSVNPYGLIPIIQAQLAARAIDEAIQLTKLTDDLYLKSYLLWAVATQVKDRKRQLDIAATIPVESVKALTYKDIAGLQLADGDVRGCLSSLTVATEAAPATYNNIARADLQWRIAGIFARAHDIAQARKVAMTIEREGHRNFALRDIIGVQASGQDDDGALQTALLGTGEDSLTDYALSRIAERQVVVAPLGEAIATIAKIKSDEVRGVALASVTEAAAEAGQIAAALTLIQVHRRAVEESLRFVETPGTLEQLSDDRARKVSNDVSLFQRALAGALGKIARSRAGNGALQEALGYALLIPEEDESGRTLEWLSFNQAKGGDVDGALRWITTAQLPSQKAFALSGVAGALMLKDKK